MDLSSIGFKERLVQLETGGLSEEFTYEGYLPSMFEESLEMVNPLPLQVSVEKDSPFQKMFEWRNPFQESGFEMDNPFQEFMEMEISSEETTSITQPEFRADDAPRDENKNANKEGNERSEDLSKQAGNQGGSAIFEDVARIRGGENANKEANERSEDLSKQAGNQDPSAIFEGLSLTRRARESAGKVHNHNDETDIEIMTEEERKEMGPWISRDMLNIRYRSGDAQPWFSELSRPSTKAKPKRAQVAALKPSKPAQTDPPKRGRGRPRKYAVDDPRSSLYRAKGQKKGVCKSKKAAWDFAIYDDGEGTNGVSQPSRPGRSAAGADEVHMAGSKSQLVLPYEMLE